MTGDGLRRVGFALPLCLVLLVSCSKDRPGHVLDEASRAGRSAESFPAADEDYFRDMDGGVALTPAEVQGRNTWIVWTGGNDRFWDVITVSSFGAFDLLKILSSHNALKFSRDNRWYYLGLVNEPCFDKATGPDAARLRAVARQAPGRLSSGSLRERQEISGRRDRRARQEPARRARSTDTPAESSGCGCFRIPTSTRRPPGSGTPSDTTTTRRTTCRRS